MGPARDPRVCLGLDADALIALETQRGRALLREIATGDHEVVISAGALGQAWRSGTRQVLLAILLRRQLTVVIPLDQSAAKACGQLLARTDSRDVIDAHVVLSALEHRARAIVTSDERDLQRLDPRIALHRI